MSWLVRYTFTPEHAPEFAWEDGQMSYEECVETLDDMILFLQSFPEAISSFSCVHSTCSQPGSDPLVALLSTTSMAPCADSTTARRYPGLAALLSGEGNNLAGIVSGAVLYLILLALAILVTQFT